VAADAGRREPVAMATTQRVRVLGVLALWLSVVTLTALTSIGLISFELPGGLTSSLDRIGEILPWARLLLAIALAAWVVRQTRVDVE
jgi:prepilin signal peptidase PulO-like enzyme (type II secretory pathway)